MINKSLCFFCFFLCIACVNDLKVAFLRSKIIVFCILIANLIRQIHIKMYCILAVENQSEFFERALFKESVEPNMNH